jgi:hypothetical protein
MYRGKSVRLFGLLGVLFAASVLLGCGHQATSAPVSQGNEDLPVSASREPSEAPMEMQIEQKLDPLTTGDVELYLGVMRNAAARTKNLLPSDRAALQSARKVLADSVAGSVPSMQDAKTLERANLVALHMDQIVAEEMKIDARKYRGIAEAIEFSLAKPAQLPVVDAGEPPVPQRPVTPIEKRLTEVNEANKKFLAPYQAEIQALLAMVRNPANLPM